MLKQKIEKYFKTYPDLRVLFFFDEGGNEEVEKELESLALDGIRVVKAERNFFFLKTKLHGDWKQEKVFLHLSMAAPRKPDQYRQFPLLDLLLANRELLLDDVEDFMEEYRLEKRHRQVVQRYMRELRYSKVRSVCAPLLHPDHFEEKALVQGLLSAFLGFSKPTDWPLLLVKLLTLSRDGQEDDRRRVAGKIRDNGLLEWLNRPLKQYFDQELQAVNQEALAHLLKLLKYNTLTQDISQPANEDPYRDLKIKSRPVVSRMNQLLEEARKHDGLAEQLQEALDQQAAAVQELKLLEVYPAADFAYLTLPMKWEILARQLSVIDFNPKAALQELEKLGFGEPEASSFKAALSFFTHAADLISRINAIPGYVLDQPDEYVKTYTGSLYKIDQAYRRALSACQNIDQTEVPPKVNLEELTRLVNKHYETYLEKLNREWLNCLKAYHFNYADLKTPKQYEFFKQEVEPSEQKVVVIISDALRYEAAEELLSELHGDPKNSADIRYRLASIPSKTSVGMAQLLPGKSFQFNGGKILVDGLPTDGLDNRNKLLAAYDPEARALQFQDVQNKGQKEKREIFKAPLVYIYHDAIDMIGDKKASERKTFDAVRDAIAELKRFVKLLHGSYNVARVLVTADHGFLFNSREIDEVDKENPTGLQALQTHNRYELVDDPGQPVLGHKLPLSATTRFKDELSVVIPESVNRYRKQGVGHQFVHGGGSLQELVVPVIESSRKTQNITQKVKPVLLKKGTLKVVSNILRVDVLQEAKVSRTEKERELVAGLYKDLDLVSNQVSATLNSTSDNPSERMHRLEFTLLSSAAGESFLKLKIFDKEDTLNTLLEEKVDNNTLIQQDF